MSSDIKYYLGVDGGATKTEAVIINEKKEVLGRGMAAGSNADIFGLSESVDRVYAAVEQAGSGKKIVFTASCLAIAGIDTQKDRSIWTHAVQNHHSLSTHFSTKPLVVNDVLAALRSGTTKKNAIVVIAGTGSNCYGRNESGDIAKSSGVGNILSDEGSGYNIGLRILKRVTQSIDGRSSQTILKELLFEKLRIQSLDNLISQVYEKPWNKADIASLAPLAEKGAGKGDKVAKAILAKAASDLGIMIKAVATKLKLKNKKYYIVTAGSIFKIENILINHLKKDIKKFSPNAKFIDQKVNSPTAAAYLALESV